MSRLHTELLTCKKIIIKFYKQIKKLTPKKSNSYKIQRIFIKDFKRRFEKMIIKDGKYRQFSTEFIRIEEPIYIEKLLN